MKFNISRITSRINTKGQRLKVILVFNAKACVPTLRQAGLCVIVLRPKLSHYQKKAGAGIPASALLSFCKPSTRTSTPHSLPLHFTHDFPHVSEEVPLEHQILRHLFWGENL